MWMLVGVILQIGPAATPPVTLQQPFASEAACGNAKNDLETQYRRKSGRLSRHCRLRANRRRG